MGQERYRPDFSAILEKRLSRRHLLHAVGGAALAASVPISAIAVAKQSSTVESKLNAAVSTLTFEEVPAGMDAHHHLAKDYHAQVLMRWGDKVLPDAPAFDPHDPTPEAQAKQFGFNNDFIAYFPLDDMEESVHGLLCVNHEYTVTELMFGGFADKKSAVNGLNESQIRTEMAAQGVSIVEIKHKDGQWQPVYGDYNRRIMPTTPVTIKGPVAGHTRVKTSADPAGETVFGTMGNCAGGMTPWGTYLTCEENINEYFQLNGYAGDEKDNHANMGMWDSKYHRWDKVDKRFDISKEPNEPNRFGWVVEIDPRTPDSTPCKRTALGRFKHESASTTVNTDGRVVIYMGDDEAFQFIYKFLSDNHYDPNSPNPHMLDAGTLYAARFDADGTLTWLPLVHGEGPLTKEKGFHSQADVLIEARRAASLLGATPMDRPEGVAINRNASMIYAALTKNPAREKADAVNRRASNPMGYVLAMQPPAADHSKDVYGWDIFLEGGDPNANGNEKGAYDAMPSGHGWLACPDNLVVDVQGRLWITTDGQPEAVGRADGVYAADTAGEAKGMPRCFFRGPIGCEVTGPQFSPDGKTFFLSVQHPGEDSTFDNPSTRWPDFNPTMPPRPSVLAITKKDGGLIGG